MPISTVVTEKVQKCKSALSLPATQEVTAVWLGEASICGSTYTNWEDNVISRLPKLLGQGLGGWVSLTQGNSHTRVPDERSECCSVRTGNALEVCACGIFENSVTASRAVQLSEWLLQHSVLEPRLLTDVIEFHRVVSLHLSTAVSAPIAVRTGCYSHWQLGSRNVLPILVGQLSEATQATAVTQHSVCRDPVIRQ